MKYNPLIASVAIVGLLGTTAMASYVFARKELINDFVAQGILNKDLVAGIGISIRGDMVLPDADNELEAASFLYEQAKHASEEGEWLRVKALLNESVATKRIDYEQYAAALLLLGEATEKVAGIEARIAGELDALRQEATRETTARKSAQVKEQQTASQLVDTKKAKDAQEADLLQKLSVSEEGKKVAEARAKDEERAAFINELDVYVALLKRGDTALISAEGEIDAGRDVQSLVYLNQATDLFDQIEQKGIDLRDNRTPSEYVSTLGELLRAVGMYNTSAKAYRGMVALLPERGNEYDLKRSTAITARLDGFAVLGIITKTIAGAR